MDNTTINGVHELIGLSGLIYGMVNMIEIMRKYTLASLLNCRSKALMRKSYHVYLDVLTKLDSNQILFLAGGFLGLNSKLYGLGKTGFCMQQIHWQNFLRSSIFLYYSLKNLFNQSDYNFRFYLLDVIYFGRIKLVTDKLVHFNAF